MKQFVLLSIVSLVVFVTISTSIFAADTSPNIIFILTDDLGYGDIGVLHQNQRKIEGKPYHQTPNYLPGNTIFFGKSNTE